MSDPLLRAISGPTTGSLVFAFPPAGSGPSIFRQWLPVRPRGLELIAIHTPGREDRCSEPPVSSVKPLADDIAAAIDEYSERPYVIFGHSAGALLGREVAWRLRRSNRPVRLLIAAGSAAPDVTVDDSLAEADDVTLSRVMHEWGGISQEVLNSDAAEVILPCMRADMALANACRRDHPPTAEDRLDIPIAALAGADDSAIHLPDCQRWSTWTDAASTFQVLPGGHFFPFEQPAAVLEFIERDAGGLGGPVTTRTAG
ncbi:MAG TPA: alpha/beta fold hydrolase [Jatrophihabitans sp.]|nr:alpha/beta fold hydrolase [Jatrophihabitans sp.]